MEKPVMRVLKVLALSAFVLSAVEVKADDPVIKWACWPNLVCDQFTPVFYRDEDRADDSNRGEPSVDNGGGGGAVGASPGPGAPADPPSNARPSRDPNCVGQNR